MVPGFKSLCVYLGIVLCWYVNLQVLKLPAWVCVTVASGWLLGFHALATLFVSGSDLRSDEMALGNLVAIMLIQYWMLCQDVQSGNDRYHYRENRIRISSLGRVFL